MHDHRPRPAARRGLGTLCLALCLPGLMGCGMLPWNGDEEHAGELAAEKAEINKLLGEFEAAVNKDDMAAITQLLSPVLEQSATQEIESEIRDAIRTFTYSDCKLQYDEAVGSLRWRQIGSGRVVMKLRYRTGSGEPRSDRFVLRRYKGKWLLGDVHMRMPKKGEPLDMPPAERTAILTEVQKCVDALQAGDNGFGMFVTAFEGRQTHALHNEAFREDHTDWLTGVQVLFQSAIRKFSFSQRRAAIVYRSTSRVHVPVPIEYKYPPTGKGKHRQASLAFVFVERQSRWVLMDMHIMEQRRWFSSLIPGG